jgi:hypothetical protein
VLYGLVRWDSPGVVGPVYLWQGFWRLALEAPPRGRRQRFSTGAYERALAAQGRDAALLLRYTAWVVRRRPKDRVGVASGSRMTGNAGRQASLGTRLRRRDTPVSVWRLAERRDARGLSASGRSSGAHRHSNSAGTIRAAPCSIYGATLRAARLRRACSGRCNSSSTAHNDVAPSLHPRASPAVPLRPKPPVATAQSTGRQLAQRTTN